MTIVMPEFLVWAIVAAILLHAVLASIEVGLKWWVMRVMDEFKRRD